MSNKDILVISIFGYGVQIQYLKDNWDLTGGTIEKFEIRYRNSGLWNPYIAITLFYQYCVIFRLLLNRG